MSIVCLISVSLISANTTPWRFTSYTRQASPKLGSSCHVTSHMGPSIPR